MAKPKVAALPKVTSAKKAKKISEAVLERDNTPPALRATMQEDAAKPTPSKLNIGQLRILCLTLAKERETVEMYAQRLADAQAVVTRIEQQTMPLLLDQAGVTRIVVDGYAIELKDEVYPNVKKELQPKFYEWLRLHKFGALIKNQVIASFGMGEDAKAIAIAAALIKKKVDVTQKQSVHPGTLKAWVVEQREKAAPLPSMVDLNPVRRANVTKKG